MRLDEGGSGGSVPPLELGEVQVWRVSATRELVSVGEALLSADELERMQRLRVPLARDEFVVGRALLRVLVGAALGCEAREVGFDFGAAGKPSVAGGGVEFNVAHSRGEVLIALCREGAVGVDVEWVNAGIEALHVARSSFAAAEVQAIEAAVGSARVEAFFRVWVKKEALVKAHGGGLVMGLDTFAVSADAEEEAVKVGEEWVVRGIEVREGWMGAFAVGAGGLRVRVVAPQVEGLVGMLERAKSLG